MSDLDQISTRMRDTMASVMPKIDSALSGRSSSIDLSTAENWLVRPELEEIYKAAIQSGLSSEVSSASTRQSVC